jgi:hypothetical protein
LWFSQDEISSKRQHIRKAILEIAEQQNPDTIRKLGLESKKKKTATKAVEKYNDWLNQMMTSEFHFYRGYSEIEIPGKFHQHRIEDLTMRLTHVSALANL